MSDGAARVNVSARGADVYLKDRLGARRPVLFLWKHMPYRDKEYLAFIRALPCLVCGAESEPHHWRKGADGGTGMKPSDCFALPLCHEHHMEAHRVGEATFAERRNFEPWRAVAFLMRDYLQEKT